jgi:hypothetical protein
VLSLPLLQMVSINSCDPVKSLHGQPASAWKFGRGKYSAAKHVGNAILGRVRSGLDTDRRPWWTPRDPAWPDGSRHSRVIRRQDNETRPGN